MDVPKTGFLRRVLGAERAGRVRRLTRSILQTGRRRLGRGGVQGERGRDPFSSRPSWKIINTSPRGNQC